MRLHRPIGRLVARGTRKHLNRRPSIELIESRLLMATGFVQGFDLDASNTPIPGATVKLENTSTSQIITTTTDASGYYAFNGVAPGTYDVTETSPGYTTSGVSINTTINPAVAIGGNTGIQVTVEDLSQQSLGLTWSIVPYSYKGANIYIDSPFQTPNAQIYDGQPAGQSDPSLTGSLGNITTFYSLCTDLIGTINIPSSSNPDTFQVQPSLSPSTASPSATNIGEIDYLYNTFGQDLQTASPGESTNGAALQLAVWALEYNATGTLNGTNFQVLSTTNQTIVNQADAYLADAAGQSEDAYFLNVTQTGNGGGQAMISTDLLNFTNKLQGQPAINTVASESNGGVVGVSSLSDVAMLSGGDALAGRLISR